MAANTTILPMVDFLNQWGLTIIGISLFLGLFSRWSSIAGAIILGLYYLSNPPLLGNESALSYQGHYMIINMNFIEMVALILLYFINESKVNGLDRLFKKR